MAHMHISNSVSNCQCTTEHPLPSQIQPFLINQPPTITTQHKTTQDNTTQHNTTPHKTTPVKRLLCPHVHQQTSALSTHSAFCHCRAVCILLSLSVNPSTTPGLCNPTLSIRHFATNHTQQESVSQCWSDEGAKTPAGKILLTRSGQGQRSRLEGERGVVG